MKLIMENVLFMSVIGSVLTIFILLIKPITKRFFSAKWNYYIWILILLLMIFPIKLQIPDKIVETVYKPVSQVVNIDNQNKVNKTAYDGDNTIFNDKLEKSGFNAKNVSINIFNILGYIWAIIVIMVLLYKTIKYMSFVRILNKNSYIDNTIKDLPKRLIIKRTNILDSPLIIGVLKPVLYLPQIQIECEELSYILIHELTHYKRKDILYKWFAMIVISIHWFNPFAYVISNKIDEECEISCDLEVCRNFNNAQKKLYMQTILKLVQQSIVRKKPLTTQMASSKNFLKRRFNMILYQKKVSKFMSVLSIIIAVFMFTGTALASGIILNKQDYNIEVLDTNGDKIEFVNQPFIKNNQIYLPLRETLEKVGYKENSMIKYNDGRIQLVIYNNGADSGFYKMQIDNINISLIKAYQQNNEYYFNMGTSLNYNMQDAPILNNSTTYLTLNDFNYIVYELLNVRDLNGEIVSLKYNIHDNKGNEINDIFNSELKQNELLKNPEKTTELFFKAFSKGDIKQMKNYCTQDCIDKFFVDDGVFGMKKASINNMEISKTVNNNSDVDIFVDVNMTPHELSVFDSKQTGTAFYVSLLKQADGTYLINDFITG